MARTHKRKDRRPSLITKPATPPEDYSTPTKADLIKSDATRVAGRCHKNRCFAPVYRTSNKELCLQGHTQCEIDVLPPSSNKIK